MLGNAVIALQAAMANPIQQGLKPCPPGTALSRTRRAAMANPIQQGLKRQLVGNDRERREAAMANPIQQGLKRPAWSSRPSPASRRNG